MGIVESGVQVCDGGLFEITQVGVHLPARIIHLGFDVFRAGEGIDIIIDNLRGDVIAQDDVGLCQLELQAESSR